jgi:hypothetical protein
MIFCLGKGLKGKRADVAPHLKNTPILFRTKPDPQESRCAEQWETEKFCLRHHPLEKILIVYKAARDAITMCLKCKIEDLEGLVLSEGCEGDSIPCLF